MKFKPDEIRAHIVNPPAASKGATRESVLQNNVVASWMHECCINDSDSFALVGVKAELLGGRKKSFEHSECHLYPSYLNYCSENGINALGKQGFASALKNAALVLGFKISEPCRKPGNGRHGIKGLRLLEPGGGF